MRSIVLASILTLATSGCSQLFFLGSWTRTELHTNWNNDQLLTCATTEERISFNRDGSYETESTYTEPQDQDCGQPEGYRQRTRTSGTWSTYTVDRDQALWMSFRQEHVVSESAIGDADLEVDWEDGDTQEYATPISNGRDKQGPFIVLGSWGDFSLYYKE